MNTLQQLNVIEKRKETITPEDLSINTWVRVNRNLERVKKLCSGEHWDGAKDDENEGEESQEADYAVGWEEGMEDTVRKCFEVTVVSKAYRTTPVVSLCVGAGLVAIGGNGSIDEGSCNSHSSSSSSSSVKSATRRGAKRARR